MGVAKLAMEQGSYKGVVNVSAQKSFCG